MRRRRCQRWVPPIPSPDFTFGTFTHLNFPIYAPSITNIRLTLSANVSIDVDEAGADPFASVGTYNFV